MLKEPLRKFQKISEDYLKESQDSFLKDCLKEFPMDFQKKKNLRKILYLFFLGYFLKHMLDIHEANLKEIYKSFSKPILAETSERISGEISEEVL